MDTRRKIVTEEQLPRPIRVVTGYFEVLRVEHIRALEQAHCRSPHFPLVVLVLQRAGELLKHAARARIVAALRIVDYVVIADHEDPDVVLERVRPADLVRLEHADLRSSGLLIEHVQRTV